MLYRNERQRIEAALPARMMYNVVAIGGDVTGENAKTTYRLMILLKEACLQPLDGLTAKDKGKVVRRIERTYATISDGFEADHLTVGDTGPIVFFFIKLLSDRGVMALFEGSPVAVALELYLPFFQAEFNDDAISALAEKRAAMVFINLQAQGLYDGF